MFLVVIGILFLFKVKHNELDVARAALAGLIQANSSVASLLNWEKLKAVGVDVGAEYSAFKIDKDKVNYKKYFIRGFSAGFKDSIRNLYCLPSSICFFISSTPPNPET